MPWSCWLPERLNYVLGVRVDACKRRDLECRQASRMRAACRDLLTSIKDVDSRAERRVIISDARAAERVRSLAVVLFHSELLGLDVAVDGCRSRRRRGPEGVAGVVGHPFPTPRKLSSVLRRHFSGNLMSNQPWGRVSPPPCSRRKTYNLFS